MKPIILLYNVKEEKYNRMKPVLGLMGIKVKLVDNGSLGDKVEYIAWPEEYANVKSRQFYIQMILILSLCYYAV